MKYRYWLPVSCACLGFGVLLAQDDWSAFTKITPKRIPMDRQVAILCVTPDAVVGPHTSPEVDILVNESVLAYRRKNPGSYSYPVGATFIKEKYSSPGAPVPDVATIMTKRKDTGSVADWDFKIVSLPDHKPISPTGRVSCVSCHDRFSKTGFVSPVSEKALRSFLSPLEKVGTGGWDKL